MSRDKNNSNNPYSKSVFNNGFIGVGEFKIRNDNNELTEKYKVWTGILQRAYGDKLKAKHKTYIDCTVCEEWHNFQNFARWYEDNYYEVEGDRMELDKDILHKGNKIYSPETCIFAPRRINVLFIKNDINRGQLPIGVSYKKENNKYQVNIRKTSKGNRKQYFLGYFSTPNEAFNAYKVAKENYIKEVADEYKNRIPYELYVAMYKWEVEIND